MFYVNQYNTIMTTAYRAFYHYNAFILGHIIFLIITVTTAIIVPLHLRVMKKRILISRLRKYTLRKITKMCQFQIIYSIRKTNLVRRIKGGYNNYKFPQQNP